jgi:hypothetical protein
MDVDPAQATFGLGDLAFYSPRLRALKAKRVLRQKALGHLPAETPG